MEQAVVGQRAETVGRDSQSSVNISSGNNGNNPESTLSRRDVLSEVREMYERDKRKSSVVLRGLGNVTVQQASSTYAAVCRYLGLEVSPLTELTKINSNLFRGRINDNTRRLELLAAVPQLRRSNEFRSVYIQKDLTYRQRGEVIAARSARRSGNHLGNDAAESVIDQGQVPTMDQSQTHAAQSASHVARASAPRGGLGGQHGRGNQGRPRGGGPNRPPRGSGRGGGNSRGRGRGIAGGPGSGSSDPLQSGRFGDESLGQTAPLSSPPATRARFAQRNTDLNE